MTANKRTKPTAAGESQPVKKERVTKDWPTNRRRTSISLPPLIAEWAFKAQAEQGYPDFTSYICELIRKDKRDCDERAAKAGPSHDQHN